MDPENGEGKSYQQDVLGKMSAEAVRELNTMRHPTAGASMKAAVKRALGRSSGYAAAKDAIFWPAGMLLLGLLEAGHDTGVRNYLADWMQDGMPVRHPDDALTGEVLLRLCEMSGVNGAYTSPYQQGAEQIYEYLKSCRRDPEGTIVYGQASNNNCIFADGVGQTVLFLAHYGRLLHSKEATKEAERQMSNFLRHGMDEKSGLPYHGYDAKSGVCHGIIGWGRAVGWLLFGLTELVQDGRGEDGIYEAALHRIVNACLERVRPDGLFSWQLDCLNGPADTSASGMIFWAINRTAGQQPAGSTEMRTVLDRGAAALADCVNPDGRVGKASAECVDFGEYRQVYGNYPWGQGAALMFLGAHCMK